MDAIFFEANDLLKRYTYQAVSHDRSIRDLFAMDRRDSYRRGGGLLIQNRCKALSIFENTYSLILPGVKNP